MKWKLFLRFFFFLWCWGMGASGALAQDKIKVVVSVLPQAFFVERIGADKVDVSVMIPPGGSPHTYEPTPSQLARLSVAELYFVVGSGLAFEQQWMKKLVDLNKRMEVVDTSQGIELLPVTEHDGDDSHQHSHEGLFDPHVWLSPSNAILMARTIAAALVAGDPDHASFYRNNAQILISELQALIREISERLTLLSNKTFFVFHPAWGYFAREFGLRQVAAESDGKELTPRQLARVVDQARQKRVRVIFASPQFSQKSAQTIASEINGRVELIDPLAKEYIENLRRVTDVLTGVE